jgi:glucose-6-phosphate isomerase
MTPRPIDKTLAWKRLQFHAFTTGKRMDLKKEFTKDQNRHNDLAIRTEHMLFDYSRQLVNKQTMGLLQDLANSAGLEQKIKDMYSGKHINVTEDRAVLHIALRDQKGEFSKLYGKDIHNDVQDVLDKVKTFSKEILSGERTGVTGKKIKNIVSIGIGGSYLGPEYLAEACKAYAKEGMTLKFVSNVDNTDFEQKTKGLDPQETLFVIVSKTFTTAETIKNAKTAKKWMIEKLGHSPEVITKHFIAVSTAEEKVKAFGIDTNNMFRFWDWVGGRYSATSAVGAVPLSLFLGYDKFKEILDGAHWMDEHFLNVPMEKNIPLTAGLLDVYNINFLGRRVRALLPYSQAYAKLPAHTQQVEMESNGKGVDLYGRKVKFSTGEVVFGEPGTNGQHSFYQLPHQEDFPMSCDFIGFLKPQYLEGKTDANDVTHQQELFTNFIAQPDALAFGKKDPLSHKYFAGNRPSSSLLLEEQTPFTAGALLAFTEHRTAVKGFVWGINSFDQFGVELGKVLGVDIRNRILLYKNNSKDPKVFEGLNPSSVRMLSALLKVS